MAKRIVQVVADIPAAPDGSTQPRRIINGFDTTAATAAADIGGALLAVVGSLPAGMSFSLTVTTLDLVNG